MTLVSLLWRLNPSYNNGFIAGAGHIALCVLRFENKDKDVFLLYGRYLPQ